MLAPEESFFSLLQFAVVLCQIALRSSAPSSALFLQKNYFVCLRGQAQWTQHDVYANQPTVRRHRSKGWNRASRWQEAAS